jgi:hypothetical protein
MTIPVDDSRSFQPPQSPQHDAADGAPMPPATAEARAVVQQADLGGVPMYVTANLKRIAEQHGIVVSSDMTPNAIVDELRRLAGPESDDATPEHPAQA